MKKTVLITLVLFLSVLPGSASAGAVTFGPNDFNQRTYLLEAPVNLVEVNSITVELASNPESRLTSEVTEDVDPPTASINADPNSIMVGMSAALAWSSTTAHTCVIEPDIGSVHPNGSTAVSPTETTTYEMTAAGPGGTATNTVTVTVLYPPTITISANPETILIGDAATLTWTSTHADTCVIEPGVGSVDPNGSTAVSPTETTTYTITVTGPGGTASANVTVEYEPVLAVNITLPKDRTTINTGLITVTGIVVPRTATVKVNGLPAAVDNGRFVAKGVRLTDGENTITAEAQTDGLVATDSVTVITVGTITVSLTGIVTDGVTGAPLEGATVVLTDVDQRHSEETLADGSYEITGIVLGEVQTSVTCPGYISKIRQPVLTRNQTYIINFTLYTQSAVATVYGSVTNAETLQRESGVVITVVGTDISGVSLEDGTFTLANVPTGEQSLSLTKEGIADNTVFAHINKGPFQMDLIFPATTVFGYPREIDTNITGYVHDALSRNPLDGAIVQVYGSTMQTTTGPDGQYTLTGLPAGSISLIAMAKGHKALITHPTVVPGAAKFYGFNLFATIKGLVTGTVTDSDTGEPIRYASIEVDGSGILTAATEANGTYQLGGVPVGIYGISATHPEYLSASVDNVIVADLSSSTVDFTLTHRPATGSLKGIITDRDTGNPISGADLQVEGATTAGTTDSSGAYNLSGLQTGLVTILIDAPSYASTTRTTAVVADEDYASPTTTTFNIELDATDPAPPNSISELIMADEGGRIESPDSQFVVVIPPGTLSGDAIVTLMSPTYGPAICPGDDLTVDPELGISGIKALGRMIQLVVEPAVEGEEVPTIQDWVLISGRYSQSTVDAFNLKESSIFPYYWDGTNWTTMRVMPYGMAVDTINNVPVAILDFSTTETGNPVTARLGTKEHILPASIDHIPNLDAARIFLFELAARVKARGQGRP